jgi:large subunit ribosomal protein L22
MAVAEETRTQVRAEARYVRTAPRKAQLVAEQIRGRPVPEARTILAFMTRDAARDVERVLSSAVANAEQKALRDNERFDADALVVKTAIVNMGTPLKRFTAAAQGRGTPILKRTSHVEIHVTHKESD